MQQLQWVRQTAEQRMARERQLQWARQTAEQWMGRVHRSRQRVYKCVSRQPKQQQVRLAQTQVGRVS